MHILTDRPHWLPGAPTDRHGRFVILAVGACFSLMAGLYIGSMEQPLLPIISLAFIVGCVIVPWISIPAALVILGFAGRFEIPPFANGLADVAFWTALGLCLAMLSNQRRATYQWRLAEPAFLSFLAFLAIVSISLLPTIEYDYAREKTFRVVVYGLIFMLMTRHFITSVTSIKRFLFFFIAFANVLALTSVAIALRTDGLMNIQRISPPSGGPITLARLMGFAAIACIGLSLCNARRALLLANALVLILLTFATGSRSPALLLVVVIVLYPAITFLNRRIRFQSWRLGIAMLAGALLAVPLLAYALLLHLPFAERFSLLVQVDRGESFSARENFLQTGLQLAHESRYLGAGAGIWPVLAHSENPRDYPHNIFIETLVEQGFWGTGMLVAFMLFTGWRAIESLFKAPDPTSACLLSIGLISFIYSIWCVP